MLIARGSLARAAFERVALPVGGPAVLTLPALAESQPDDARAACQPHRAGSQGPAAAVHGADNAAEAVLPRPAEQQAGPAGSRKRSSAAAAAMDAPAAISPAAGAAGGEQSLGDRLRALELAGGSRLRCAPAGADDDAQGEADQHGAAHAAPSAPGPVPRADSLAVLLTQALGSGDSAMLERVLSVSDAKVVANTCARLAPELALAFLAASVARLQSTPARGSQLARWVRATLVAHAAYLSSAPGAAPLLTALYGVLDARLALYRPLLALSGRLELLLAAQRRAACAGDAQEADGAAAVEYEEPEDGEVEDARGGRPGQASHSEDDSDSGDEDEEDAQEEGEEAGSEWETDQEDG